MTAPIAFRRNGTILRGTDAVGTVERTAHNLWSLRLTAGPISSHPSARDARDAAFSALVGQDGECRA